MTTENIHLNLEDKLKPLVGARDLASSNLANLRSRIAALENQLDKKRDKLTATVKKIAANESNASPESAIDLKREIASLESLINELEVTGTKEAEHALHTANDNLSTGVRGCIDKLREEKIKAAHSIIQPAIDIGLDFMKTVDQLFRDLGVAVPSYIKEDCTKVFIFRGLAPDLPSHVREFLGLESKR
jgi:hypothetical protein